MVFSALLETVLLGNHICVAFYFNFYLYYFGHLHGNAICFSSKVQLLLFLSFFYWTQIRLSAASQSLSQQLILILPEAAFWQEVKGISRRSRVGLKVQRSYFHEIASCNGKMRGQKCSSIKRQSRIVSHVGDLIFLLWFMLPTFSCFIVFLPLRCSKVFQSSCCSVAGIGLLDLTLCLRETLLVSDGEPLPSNAPVTGQSVCWESVLVQNTFQQAHRSFGYFEGKTSILVN